MNWLKVIHHFPVSPVFAPLTFRPTGHSGPKTKHVNKQKKNMRTAFLSLCIRTIVCASVLLLPFTAGAQSKMLKYKGEVLEETDEYIILKLRKAEIELSRDNSILNERKNLVRDDVLKRREYIYLEPESLTRIKSELREELKADLREEVQKQAVKR